MCQADSAVLIFHDGMNKDNDGGDDAVKTVLQNFKNCI